MCTYVVNKEWLVCRFITYYFSTDVILTFVSVLSLSINEAASTPRAHHNIYDFSF